MLQYKIVRFRSFFLKGLVIFLHASLRFSMQSTEMDPKISTSFSFSVLMKRPIKRCIHEMCIFINGRLYRSDRHDLPSLNPVPQRKEKKTSQLLIKNQPSSLKAPTSPSQCKRLTLFAHIKKSNIYIASD